MTHDALPPASSRRTTVSSAPAPGAAPAAAAWIPPGAERGTKRPDRRRLMLIGVTTAAVVGIAFALMMRPDTDRERERDPVRAGDQAQVASSGAQTFDIKVAREPYRAPDRDAVAQAYVQAGRVFAAGGVSGLARYGLECFRALEDNTSYRRLDYCLAFDAFGAAINQRASGGQPASPESYFGQSSARHLAVTEAAIGGEGDASARLIDIRRIAIEVARLSSRAVQAQGPAPSQVQPSNQLQAQAGSPVLPGVASVAAANPTPSRAAVPAPPAPRRAQASSSPATVVAAAPRAASTPVRSPPPVRTQAAASPPRPIAGPTAQEVAAARPARAAGPSFNCRYARTNSERLVCSRPELAAADRRLNDAYEDAIAAGANRAALRLEQDRWLAIREGAAPDPAAVRDVYERRIEELRSGR